MIRVLHIMGSLNRGGLETFVMNVYRQIDRERIQFDFLLTQDASGGYEEEAAAMGARIYHIPPRNKGFKDYNRALDGFFRTHSGYAAVHQHVSSLTSIAPIRYAKKHGIPVRILHAHSSAIAKSLRLRWAHLAFHCLGKLVVRRWATHWLGCSEKALDWVYRGTGVRSRAVMVNNGIDCAAYAYDEKTRETVRAELNISKDAFVMGHVGRFAPVKNHAFLIDILAEVRKSVPEAKLLLVGKGGTMDAVKAKAEEKGLSAEVVFTGERSDVARLLQAMDVFVMPSLFEGLPVSMVEAQAAGLPLVVSSAISRDSDITGTVLFKPLADTVESWAESVLAWKEKVGRADNKEKIKQIGFDSATTAAWLCRLYTQSGK